MKHHFSGVYYKQQARGRTLAIIPAIRDGERCLQILTDTRSYYLASWGGSTFAPNGLELDIDTPEVRASGVLHYYNLTPVPGNLMGPFRYLPIECRHGIISMRHTVAGQITLNGEVLDFDDGLGYIEWDKGRCFPSGYNWVQSNAFSRPSSIVAMVAEIPLLGCHFSGCVAVVWLDGQTHRLATYSGAKACRNEKGGLVITQGDSCLEIRVANRAGHPLKAPREDGFSRQILESPACRARFRFSVKGRVLFDEYSDYTSYEYAREDDENEYR